MKKGILPLKLFLIIIVLGGFAIAFTAFNDVPVELLRKHQKHVKSQNIGPSFEFLAKIRNNQITWQEDGERDRRGGRTERCRWRGHRENIRRRRQADCHIQHLLATAQRHVR